MHDILGTSKAVERILNGAKAFSKRSARYGVSLSMT
jgi:hypothetical protein